MKSDQYRSLYIKVGSHIVDDIVHSTLNIICIHVIRLLVIHICKQLNIFIYGISLDEHQVLCLMVRLNMRKKPQISHGVCVCVCRGWLCELHKGEFIANALDYIGR